MSKIPVTEDQMSNIPLTDLDRVVSVQNFLSILAKGQTTSPTVMKELDKVCYSGINDTVLKILKGLERQVYGPIRALQKLTENCEANYLCIWHGDLCASTSFNRETGRFKFIHYCPDCANMEL